MLKPADPGPPPPERPVGELVHELIEDAKAYAHAEVGLARTIAVEKGKAFVPPAILFGAAFILALAGLTALALGVVIALAKFLGPLLAGFVALLIFGALAGGCAWYGAGLVRKAL